MTDYERGEIGPVGPAGPTGPMGPGGDTGRGVIGETGATGGRGHPGATGDTGQPGATGGPGQPGVTVTELDKYILRLEGRYRRISRFLATSVIVTSIALFGTLAWTANEQGDARREAIFSLCEKTNAINARILNFREQVSPQTAELARSTFTEQDCRAEAQRLTTR